MRILFKIGIGLVALAALFFLVGLSLPASTQMERSVVIAAPVGEVYPHVADLRRWHDWSAWHKLEPDATWTYSEPASGKGAWYSWEGEQLGAGEMRVVEAVPNERIEAEMTFEGQGGADADFTFEALSPTSTEVTWSFDTEHGSVPERYFGLLLDRMLGPDYETGLANLKAVAEAG